MGKGIELPRVAYSIREAAAVLGYDDPEPVNVLVRQRQIKTFRVNPKSDKRISHAELMRFIEAREAEADSVD